MKRKSNKPVLYAATLLVGFMLTNTVFGQLFTPYTVTRTTGITYNTIYGQGGTQHINANSTTTDPYWRCGGCTYNITDDNVSTNAPIGFSFDFDGATCTQFQVSTNGFITLNSANTSAGNPSAPYNFVNSYFYSSASYSGRTIAPMYQDLVTQGNNGSQTTLDTSILYQVSGTSPNRVLTVEWRHLELYGLSLPDLNFQIKLYESTNNIELLYGYMAPGNGSYYYVLGFNSNTYGTTTSYRLTQSTQNSAVFSSGTNYMSTIPASNTKILFSRITTDLGAFAVTPPASGQCTYSASQAIVDSIKNYGVGTYDFAAHPDTVITQITGAITQSFSTIVNSGTLAAGGILAVNVGTINMTAGGSYNFKAFTNLSGDQYHPNDTVTTTVNVGSVTATATSVDTICIGGSVNLLASTSGFGHVFPISYSPVTLTSPTTISLTNDATPTLVNIGFNFKFFGNTYTSGYVSDNGNFQFSSAYSTYINQLLPSTTLPNNLIAYAWSDLNNPAGGTYSYQTMGTSPNRKFILNLTNVPVSNTTNITTQMVLYETTNLIEVQETTVPLHNYTQGIEDVTASVGYCPTGRNNLSWSASNDAYQFLSGPIYSWSPGATLNDSTIANPIATPTVTTTYTVTLNPGSACTKTNTITVVVSNGMGAIQPIAGDTILCEFVNTSFRVPAVANATSYEWDNSGLVGSTITTGSTTDSITISLGSSSGVLRVRAYNANCGAYSAWVSVYVTVIPNLNSSANQWVGGVSSNWFYSNNWCGGVPTSTVSADIDGYLGGNYGYFEYFPIINAAGATTLDMILEGNFDSLTISGSNNLDVYGNWVMGNSNVSAYFISNSSSVTFKGNVNQTISAFYANQATVPFYNLIINKGSSVSTVLEDVIGQQITVSNNLTLINGLFKVSEPTSTLQFSSGPTIPSTAGLDLDGGTIIPGNYSITNNGTFRMNTSSSDIIIGTNYGNSFTNSGSNAVMEILGGNLTICGQLVVQSDALFQFDESNATFNNSSSTYILLDSLGVTSNTKAVFDVDATSEMEVAIGNIIFHTPNSGSGIDVRILGGTGVKTITTGIGDNTFQFGDANIGANKVFDVFDTIVAFNNVSIVSALTVGTSPSVRLDTGAALCANGILDLGTGKLLLNKHPLVLNNSANQTSSNVSTLSTGAIRRTTGYIISEDSLNRSAIKWKVTASNVNYIIPFGNTYGGYIPFTFKNTASGSTFLKVATYAPTTNTALHKPYPLTVTHLRNAATGADNSANVVNRYWQIDTLVPSGTITGTVKFVFSNIAGHDETPSSGWGAGGVAQRWAGAAWSSPTNSATSQAYSSDTVTAIGIARFSPWTLSRTGSPLPIELTKFTATYNGKTVDLNWSTSSEFNNEYFTISKTRNEQEFDWVATVNGAGNSNSPQYYYAEDIYPYSGTSYYQLMQTDYNGTSTKSDLVSVYIGENGLEIIKIYGDKNGIINITVNDNLNETLAISVFDILGNMVHTQALNATVGNNYLQIKPENLPQGVYFISVSNTAKRLTSKLVY